jgi:hypothetical protein
MAFKYEHDEDRFNPPVAVSRFKAPNPIPSFPAVDILMTHGPPFTRLDRVLSKQQVGCPHLLRAVERARPLLHCFGHIHEGWGAELVKWKHRENLAKPMSTGVEVDAVSKCDVNKDDVIRNRAAFVDMSTGIKRGEETLFVNASIMDAWYVASGAPWRVDLDLRRIE